MKRQVRRKPANPVYIALAAFSLAMLGSMAYVIHTGRVLSNEHVPNVRAAGRVKLDSTLAHLWFEELQSGDRYVSAEEVWQLLYSAQFYARAMVEGGEDEPDPQRVHRTGECNSRSQVLKNLVELDLVKGTDADIPPRIPVPISCSVFSQARPWPVAHPVPPCVVKPPTDRRAGRC